MIQVRPTFSESWYRVAPLKARLRSSAQISRQFYRGDRWYVVRDPAGNQFHRVSDAAYRFVALLDGSRTVSEAWDICGGQLADDAPTQPEIIQLLSHLYSANLIEADVTPDATVLLRRHKQLTKRKMQNRLMNVLFPRIPLWDLDSFLVRWMPVVRPLISWMGAMVWLIVVISAIATLSPHWTELKTAASNAIDPKNWLWLWAVFVLIKLIHELGHAFSIRRFGGECHELGIMFLVFIPTPYVDASSVWAFPNRWHRIFVGAGGMIVELFAAAVLAIIWVNIGDKTSLGAVLCYNAMLIASVSTLMFNANPLLRYDGYYILSDFLEIANLRQKSSEYALGIIKRHVFGVKSSQPLPPIGQRFWLFTYSVASGIYRIFVGFVIVLIVAYRIPVLGTLMAIGGVITWAVVPIGKLTKYLLLDPELHRKRFRAMAFCGAVGIAAVLSVTVVKFWVYVDAQGIVEADQHEVLHVKTPGFVQKIVAKDGQYLHRGDVILIGRDPKLDAEIEARKAEKSGYEIQLRQAAALDQGQYKALLPALEASKRQLQNAIDRRNELTITAPISGTLIAPHLDEMQNAYLSRGLEIGTIASMDSLVVRSLLSQEDAQLVAGQTQNLLHAKPDSQGPVQVLFVSDLSAKDSVPAVPEITGFATSAQDSVPHPSLLQTGGGDIAADPTDPHGQRPLVRQFEVTVKVQNPGGHYDPGQRAYVRFRIDQKPLIVTWWTKLLQVLQSHENDSKLV
jgi:putative peptide zinc metalloprotease protein